MLSKNVEGFRIKGIGKISILHVIFLSLTVIGLKKSCSRGQASSHFHKMWERLYRFRQKTKLFWAGCRFLHVID